LYHRRVPQYKLNCLILFWNRPNKKYLMHFKSTRTKNRKFWNRFLIVPPEVLTVKECNFITGVNSFSLVRKLVSNAPKWYRDEPKFFLLKRLCFNNATVSRRKSNGFAQEEKW
jgi:hypothetical protein